MKTTSCVCVVGQWKNEWKTDMTKMKGLVVKNLPSNAGDTSLQFDPWVGKVP